MQNCCRDCVRHATLPIARLASIAAFDAPVLTSCACWCAQYGCLVVNAPTANTVAAAEHGIALICALSRNVAQADASVKAGKWERTKYVGVSIVGKTLAVMGFGKVRDVVPMRRLHENLSMQVREHQGCGRLNRRQDARRHGLRKGKGSFPIIGLRKVMMFSHNF